MSAAAQQVVVWLLVGGALSYLAWRWRTRARAGTCDGCSPRSIARRTGGIRPKGLTVLRDS